jgi:hypothetical protein
MIVDHRVREQLEQHQPGWPDPGRTRRLDEGLGAKRHHLSAQRAGDVRHVDQADHHDRDQLRPGVDRDRTDLCSADADGRAQEHAEQQRGERPEQIEQSADQGVGTAAQVAGGKRKRHGEEQGQEHGAGPDHQCGACAVQEADRQVAPVLVRAEQVGPVPGRPDRYSLQRDDVRGLSVDDRLVGQVVLRRRRVGDLAGVQRGGQDREDDEREHRPEHQSRAVAAEAAEGRRPRTPGRRRVRS